MSDTIGLVSTRSRSTSRASWGRPNAAVTTSAMLSFSKMALTGQTAAHWPQLTQTASPSPVNAGATTESRPRSCTPMVPTVWIWSQTVMQRRQRMHLPESRTSAALDRSISRAVADWPPKRVPSTPKSRATSCSSQSALRSQLRQSCTWSESISSTAVRRARCTRGVLVRMTMPSAAASMQLASRLGRPACSTTQTRQTPASWTPAR